MYDDAGGYDCSTKYRIAKEAGFAFPLKSMDGTEEKVETRDNGEEMLMLTRTISRDFATSRTRWFFVTIGDCPERCDPHEKYCASGVDVKYVYNMTNGNGWDMYFSADVQASVIFSPRLALPRLVLDQHTPAR